MPTRKLTVRLPEEEIAFAKNYASSHGLTLTELIDRFFKRLQDLSDENIHPDILKFSGILPEETDAKEEYVHALEEKHR